MQQFKPESPGLKYTVAPRGRIIGAVFRTAQHFFFDEDGITDKPVESRRLSSYFVPVPQPKKKGKQLALGTEWTQDRIEESKFINAVRNAVAKWRFGGYKAVQGVGYDLLVVCGFAFDPHVSEEVKRYGKLAMQPSA